MSDKSIEKSNTLALFNMVRIIEDWFISKNFVFSIILLPIDITILAAVLLSRFERFISHKVISGFLRYLHYDLTILRELSRMVVQRDYISEELTKDQTEGETKLEGKAFKRIQYILRFFWSLIVFLVIFPILPILWLWNFLAPEVLIGWLYYVILFNDLNIILSIFLFSIATFLIATLTVPWIFGAYVIIKNLFSLERKSYREIKHEAETFFTKLYRYRFEEDSHDETPKEEDRGGVYYLFLKVIHAAKDQSLGILRSISKKRATALFMEKLKLGRIREELLRELNDRQPISAHDLIVPILAFIFTFAVAIVMVYAGTKGEGILGSLMLSILNPEQAGTIWFAYQGNMGYLEHYLVLAPILINILGGIGFLIDHFFGYLFIVWHSVVPYYLDFSLWYYGYISGMLAQLFS